MLVLESCVRPDQKPAQLQELLIYMRSLVRKSMGSTSTSTATQAEGCMQVVAGLPKQALSCMKSD